MISSTLVFRYVGSSEGECRDVLVQLVGVASEAPADIGGGCLFALLRAVNDILLNLC